MHERIQGVRQVWTGTDQSPGPWRQPLPSVLVGHDQLLLRDLLVSALRSAGFREVYAAPQVGNHAVLAEAERRCPSVVLMAVDRDRTAIPTIARLVAGGAVVLVLTDDHDPLLLAACLEAGAAGLFDSTQSFDQLVSLVSDAATGRTVLEAWAREEILHALRSRQADERRRRAPFWALSDSESEVLAMMAQGKHAEEMARIRVVTVSTVRSQIRSILRKLGVNSQLAAVVLAEHAGWPFEDRLADPSSGSARSTSPRLVGARTR